MNQADLGIEEFSNALSNCSIDLVVTGSIGAVEAVKFVRCLRRIGATPTVWMSEGAKQFTTETALSWAAAKPVRTDFSGCQTHTALGDACIVAPASASFISKLATGITDSAPLALVASYFGQGKPVFILPNMHNSLAENPLFKKNLAQLTQLAHILSHRSEEGKHKFPEPKDLADQVAHVINKKEHKSLIAFGGTKGYIDDVRYIANYSSGALGTKIAEEAFRQGIQTQIVCGSCQIRPKSYTQITDIVDNKQLEDACVDAMEKGSQSAVMASSVLDFVPSKRLSGKVRSQDQLEVSFVKTEKIISKVNPPTGIKVGFKLESQLDSDSALAIARDYMPKYKLSLMVLNQLSEVSSTDHKAFLIRCHEGDFSLEIVESKQAIAKHVVTHILSSINQK